ncbi:MAG: ABATE domain-containing protein [Nitrospira sp.]|nr:ABATE domain-containing protein [Nitrospira sp.]
MKKGSRKFLFVGNHPCLDFVNTQMIVKGEPTDTLESFEDLVSWLVQAKLLTASQAAIVKGRLSNEGVASLLEQAKTLRATFRVAAERVSAGRSIPDSAIDTINQFLAQRPGYQELVRTKGGFKRRFHSLATPPTGLLTPLAEAASDLLTSGHLSLIKKCANASCILFFYDTTKNHTRSWCSMQMCGNRMKVAAHYRRSRGKASL